MPAALVSYDCFRFVIDIMVTCSKAQCRGIIFTSHGCAARPVSYNVPHPQLETHYLHIQDLVFIQDPHCSSILDIH